MSDGTHMSKAAIESVRVGRVRPAGPAWVTRACDGVKQLSADLLRRHWCGYDLMLDELRPSGLVIVPSEPGQLPTCPGCAVKLDEAMETGPVAVLLDAALEGRR